MILDMAGDSEFERYRPLVERAKQAFATDTSYAIAVAKQAGALVARRNQQESSAQLGEQTADAV